MDKQIYNEEKTKMQQNRDEIENELLKKLFQDVSKTPVRVADCLLEEVDKVTSKRQDWINLAIIEKLARETSS